MNCVEYLLAHTDNSTNVITGVGIRKFLAAIQINNIITNECVLHIHNCKLTFDHPYIIRCSNVE